MEIYVDITYSKYISYISHIFPIFSFFYSNMWHISLCTKMFASDDILKRNVFSHHIYIKHWSYMSMQLTTHVVLQLQCWLYTMLEIYVDIIYSIYIIYFPYIYNVFFFYSNMSYFSVCSNMFAANDILKWNMFSHHIYITHLSYIFADYCLNFREISETSLLKKTTIYII